jgi:uncharacterized protein (DUF342 family)
MRDIEVTNMIVQSHVKTRGQVVVARGRIVGGEVTAHCGIIVGQAGANGGASTHLVAGVDYKLPEELATPRAELEQLGRDHEKIKERVDRYRQGESTISEKEFDGLTVKEKQLEHELDTARGVLKNISRCSKRQAVKEVRVLRRYFPGTTVKIGVASLEIEDTFDNPHVYNKVTGQIAISPLKN